MKLSIVIPCLNEEETLERVIAKAYQGIKLAGLEGEVVVADNGSTDRSVEIARQMGARIVFVKERGYGAALYQGIEHAQGEWIIMGDADDSYDFSQIGGFIDLLRDGADLVVGCRFPVGGGHIAPGAMPPLNRYLGNPILSWLGRFLFGLRTLDFHCGLRAFRRAAIRGLELRTTGMEYASEMIIKASLNQLRIEEVPIILHKDGRSRPPHLRPWRDGWRHLRFMLLMAPVWLFLAPGVSLMLAGTIGGIRLAAGPIYIGSVGLSSGTQLACSLAVLVGFQLCIFAIFARLFATANRLAPESRLLNAFLPYTTLEGGIVLGLLMGMAGAFLFLVVFWQWQAVDFGYLPYQDTLRQIIPAITLLALSIQMIFSSFFMSILGLRQRV